MTTKTLLHTILVDRSGSMYSMGGTHKTQLRNYIRQLQETANTSGNTILITVATNDDKWDTWIDTKNVLEVKLPTDDELSLWAEPRGMTRMYDAILYYLNKKNESINEYKKNLPEMERDLDTPVECWMYIITDGCDNKSTHTASKVKQVMEAERSAGLGTIFLAANQGNAQDLASSLGMNRDTALTIGADSVTSEIAMGYANDLTRQISSNSSGSGPSPPPSFSALQRTASAPQDHSMNTVSIPILLRHA
jgi:hypothetical protein